MKFHNSDTGNSLTKYTLGFQIVFSFVGIAFTVFLLYHLFDNYELHKIQLRLEHSDTSEQTDNHEGSEPETQGSLAPNVSLECLAQTNTPEGLDPVPQEGSACTVTQGCSPQTDSTITKESSTQTDTQEPSSKKLKEKYLEGNLYIYSTVVFSYVFVAYVILLDSFAVNKRIQVDDEIFHSTFGNQLSDQAFQEEFSIAIIILCQDLLISFAMLIGLCGKHLWKVAKKYCSIKCTNKAPTTSSDYVRVPGNTDGKPTEEKLQTKKSICGKKMLSLKWFHAIFGPVSCTIIHSYHILIGFIHTPQHATSVLILYGIVLFVYLIALRTTYFNLLSLIACYEESNESKLTKCLNCLCCRTWTSKQKEFCIPFVLFLTAIFLALTFAYVSFLFILLPIKNVIDDAGNQFLSINQTALVIFGAAITFGLYRQKKGDTSTVLDYGVKVLDRRYQNGQYHINKEKWQEMSDERKREEVVAVVLDAYIPHMQR